MFHELCKIISNEKLNSKYSKLVFQSKNISKNAKPGQFIHVKVNKLETDPLLRRPISINNVNKDKISLIYKIVGKGTEILSNILAGETLDVLGPLGNGFLGRDVTCYVPTKDESVLLVGGGIGIAPLLYLAEHLVKNNIKQTVLLGGNSKDDLICYEDFEKLGLSVKTATMDGSEGHKGFVTDLIKKHDVIFSCGPDVMLKKVSEISDKYDVKNSYISMENRMGCGVGVCLGCVIDTVRGKERVCKDGPVFSHKDVVWGTSHFVPHSELEKRRCPSISIGNLKFKNPM